MSDIEIDTIYERMPDDTRDELDMVLAYLAIVGVSLVKADPVLARAYVDHVKDFFDALGVPPDPRENNAQTNLRT